MAGVVEFDGRGKFFLTKNARPPRGGTVEKIRCGHPLFAFGLYFLQFDKTVGTAGQQAFSFDTHLSVIPLGGDVRYGGFVDFQGKGFAFGPQQGIGAGSGRESAHQVYDLAGTARPADEGVGFEDLRGGFGRGLVGLRLGGGDPLAELFDGFDHEFPSHFR